MTDSRLHNVLMIAYEFPPSAGGGVQRALKLARYLPESDWRPYVLSATVTPGTPTDESLLAEVAHVEARYLPNRHVATAVARFLAPAKRVSRWCRPREDSWLGRGRRTALSATGEPVATRVARRFFLDSAEVWSRSLPEVAKQWATTVRFDAVLATGPPHSVLVAGSRVARELGVPYVADMRDAWSSNPGYRWPDAPSRDRRSHELEREVLASAQAVIAVSKPIADEARAAGATRTVVIPNGFDPAEMPEWDPVPGPLTVALMGNFYGSTDPTPFLAGARMAIERGGPAADLRIEVLGSQSDFMRDAIVAFGLSEHVRYLGFRPHVEALATVARTDLGLVALSSHPGAEAIYTGKLFEYLGMGLPVLILGPESGVAAALVREAAAGVVVPYGDANGVADALERAARQKAAGERDHSPRRDVVARFSRPDQARSVARVLDEVLGENVE